MVLELMPCATHSRLWCGFDAVSSRLPPPFPSLSRSSLVCLCCHCGCSLFYSFGFLHSLLPPSRHYASARPHVNRHHSPALHPVFQQLVPTAGNLLLHPSALVVFRYAPLMVFAEGEGFEPPMCALRSIIYYNVRRQIRTRCLRPLGQPSLSLVFCVTIV